MDPVLVSAVAASAAALTAIYATLSAPSRERKAWQRDAVVRAAAEIRAAYERWHDIETLRLDGTTMLTAEELRELQKDCLECYSQARRAEATLQILGAVELADEAGTATMELAGVMYALKEFVQNHPNGYAVYDGPRVCSLDGHMFSQGDFDRAVQANYQIKGPRMSNRTALKPSSFRPNH